MQTNWANSLTNLTKQEQIQKHYKILKQTKKQMGSLKDAAYNYNITMAILLKNMHLTLILCNPTNSVERNNIRSNNYIIILYMFSCTTNDPEISRFNLSNPKEKLLCLVTAAP